MSRCAKTEITPIILYLHRLPFYGIAHKIKEVDESSSILKIKEEEMLREVIIEAEEYDPLPMWLHWMSRAIVVETNFAFMKYF